MLHYTSLFEAATAEIGDYYWIAGGPWIDAQDEETLEDAIDHCESCCECIIEDSEDYDPGVEYIPLKRDLVFLKYILKELETDHPWVKEIEQMIIMISLTKSVA